MELAMTPLVDPKAGTQAIFPMPVSPSLEVSPGSCAVAAAKAACRPFSRQARSSNPAYPAVATASHFCR
jgi:hypothetical protein